MALIRVGRNDPCPCGSGKKYKQCCMQRDRARAAGAQSVARQPALQVPGALNAALEHHNAGRLVEAEGIYRQILQAEPNNPDALHLLGLVAHQMGSSEMAVELVGRAANLNPANAVINNNLGNLLRALGKFEAAADRFETALKLEPGYAEAHCNLANALQALGKSGAAIERYQKALALKPDFVEAHNNLGNVLYAQGQLDASIASYRRALAFRPDHAEAHNNLGIALHDLGRLDEAAESYRISIGLRPEYAEAHNNFGVTLQAQGTADAAVVSFRKAIALKPDYFEAHSNLGNSLLALGKKDEAIVCYHRALALRPDYPVAHFNLANAFRDQHKLDEAVASYRAALAFNSDFVDAYINLGSLLQDKGKFAEAEANFHAAIALSSNDAKAYFNLGNALREQDKLTAALESFRKALELKPDYVDAHSNLLYAMQFVAGQSAQALLAEHRRFAARFEAPLRAVWQAHRNSREPGKRLKIGYVSPDFRRHAVAYFIEPVLANHDRNEVEVFCYFNSLQRDDFTDRIATHADHWLACKGMGDEELAQRIRADAIDILVDLAGHTSGNRMLVFARKPAPVQVTYLGYPGTSGLSGMDYRLTDAYGDVEGSEANYSEELLRMPHSLCCYRPAGDMPEVQPLPALHNGYITFGSFNNANKIGEACVELWAALLRGLPGARLLMVTVPEGERRERLARLFAARGVGPERLEFKGKLPSGEFQRMFQRADIALDPTPVTGGTTTCESLWMGLPVVVLAGERFISRVGYSFLTAAGVPEFAADSPEGYIGTAMRLAADIPRLAEIRSGLRKKLAASALMDEAGFARNLEHIYRDIWARWCAAGAGTPAHGAPVPE